MRLAVPRSGHWHVVVDMQGLRGSTRAGVRKLPAALLRPLPPIREARRDLAASRIDYVLVCSTYQDPLVSANGTNLASLLARGSAPGYLDPVTLPAGNPLRLWRVQRP